MSVRKVTVIKNRSYYYSSFNPIKIFGTEIAAKQYENQYALESMGYFTFFDRNDIEIPQGNDPAHGDKWEYHYDTDVEWRMEDRELVEVVTHTPRFYWWFPDSSTESGYKREEVNFSYIYNQAYYMSIHTNPKDKMEYQYKIRRMNKAIQKLNKYWKLDIPKQKGKFKFTKKNKWEKV